MRIINKFLKNVGIGTAEKITVWVIILIITAIWGVLTSMNNGAYNGTIARSQNETEHPKLKATDDTLKMNDVQMKHCIELIQKDIEEINDRDEREYQMLLNLYSK